MELHANAIDCVNVGGDTGILINNVVYVIMFPDQSLNFETGIADLFVHVFSICELQVEGPMHSCGF